MKGQNVYWGIPKQPIRFITNFKYIIQASVKFYYIYLLPYNFNDLVLSECIPIIFLNIVWKLTKHITISQPRFLHLRYNPDFRSH